MESTNFTWKHIKKKVMASPKDCLRLKRSQGLALLFLALLPASCASESFLSLHCAVLG